VRFLNGRSYYIFQVAILVHFIRFRISAVLSFLLFALLVCGLPLPLHSRRFCGSSSVHNGVIQIPGSFNEAHWHSFFSLVLFGMQILSSGIHQLWTLQLAVIETGDLFYGT
jgi:hypothetical protein